ncbi:GDSL esterase/lipase [Camellia lanceoleosa]|uniref:GDSL esterase/lipase n=1 Tax=Camellia lanceoleosa TaxID=1840588 RepID=A0ACC0HTA0_9ERIC|nr:GDSL esterase/lipase [Camellia lanceoleosa]
MDFNFPAVFNFGDSNSDTGGLVAGIAEPLEPPNGQIYFKKPSGRFLDAMDLQFLNSYLDSIGLPNFKKGCNFAATSSTILPATASSVSPFLLGIQVSQFLRFKARVLDFHSKSMFLVNF